MGSRSLMLLTPTSSGDLLVLALVGLMGWHTWRQGRLGRWMLLDPINAFWVGVFVCYIEQPVRAGDILIAWHDESVFNRTLFAALFGMVFVVAGYESGVGFRLAQTLPRLPARLSSDRLLAAAVLLVVAGLGGYAYIIEASGGWEQWLSVGRGGTDYEKVQGYLPELANGLPAGVSLLLLRSGMQRVSAAARVLAWVAATALWLWFLYLGTRSRLIAFSIVALASYYLPRQRSPHFVISVLVALGLYAAVKLQENYRDQFTHLSLNLGEVDRRELWGNILPDFLGGNPALKRASVSAGTEFNCAMATIKLVPGVVPYNYGFGFLEIFTRPIPRAWWAGKRYPHIESVQGVLREGELTATPVTTVESRELLMGPAFAFVGHWYYVGGFVGLLIGGISTGVLFRFIRGFRDRSPTSEGVIVTYPFLISIGFSEAASTPGYWIFTMPFLLLPYLVTLYVCREGPMTAVPSCTQDGRDARIAAAGRMDWARRAGSKRRWAVFGTRRRVLGRPRPAEPASDAEMEARRQKPARLGGGRKR